MAVEESAAPPAFTRILLKLSGEALMGDLEYGTDPERVQAIATNIAAANPLAITEEEVPAEDREREERIATEQAAERPENVRERIVSGKLEKWLDEVVLLRQKHVNEDKHGGKTIEELRAALSAETRENIVVRRFARFAVGG